MIQVIQDYATLCRADGTVPKKIILTFTPCGRRKTLEFIKWLGMQVPQEAEERIFAGEAAAAAAAATAAQPTVPGAKKPKKPKPAVELSCDLLCDNLRRILVETAGCGVPLGLNVESVSGFKDEIDATHDLFRSLQAILLDSTGSPWVMHWSRMDHVLTEKVEMDQRREAMQHVVAQQQQTPPLQLAIIFAAAVGLVRLVT
jgi:hypothetical protein